MCILRYVGYLLRVFIRDVRVVWVQGVLEVMMVETEQTIKTPILYTEKKTKKSYKQHSPTPSPMEPHNLLRENPLLTKNGGRMVKVGPPTSHGGGAMR